MNTFKVVSCYLIITDKAEKGRLYQSLIYGNSRVLSYQYCAAVFVLKSVKQTSLLNPDIERYMLNAICHMLMDNDKYSEIFYVCKERVEYI